MDANRHNSVCMFGALTPPQSGVSAPHPAERGWRDYIGIHPIFNVMRIVKPPAVT